jgi:TonB family protein
MSARALEVSSFEARDSILAATKDWQFRPFARGPACAVVRLGSSDAEERLPLAPARNDNAIYIPPKMLEPYRIAGTKLVVPDDMGKTKVAQAGLSRIAGTFRLCIDERGQPSKILLVQSTGLPSYDRDIIEAMKGWRYKPLQTSGGPIGACTHVTFIYSQR